MNMDDNKQLVIAGLEEEVFDIAKQNIWKKIQPVVSSTKKT